ncbi:hypothetical protein H5T87_08690 [bacterium]|nr:hypothetical protein [bacterium]
MLRRLAVLVLFGVLLAGSIAFSQPIALSEVQMENAKAGCWAMCNTPKHCCDYEGCYYPGYPAPYSYLYQPYLHYVCSFSLYPASCSNINPNMKCCTILVYELPGCNGEYLIGYQVKSEPGCGYYP